MSILEWDIREIALKHSVAGRGWASIYKLPSMVSSWYCVDLIQNVSSFT